MRKNSYPYPVEFAEDVFNVENETLAVILRTVTGADKPRVMIVADMNVVQHSEGLGTKIGRYVQAHGIQLTGSPVVIAGGEKVKSDDLQSVVNIVSAMLTSKVGVGDCMLAIGGGALLDVACYAAAQVRGGVKVVRMPTTIAAMIDAGFAEKAAVDYQSVKDALSVPSVPAAIVIDTTFNVSILDGVWRGGYAEAVRLAAVSDGPLMKKLAAQAAAFKNRDAEACKMVVESCVASRMKKGDTGFALWNALRLEAMSGFKLPHGYAVAMGIVIDTGYAVAKGLLSEKDRAVIVGALRDCGALDGIVHSQHLLAQPDNILLGLDAWKLSTGSEAIVLPTGLGKSVEEPMPDRGAMKDAINMVK